MGYLKSLVVIFGFAITSEFIYECYKKIRKRIHAEKSIKELIWFSDGSVTCDKTLKKVHCDGEKCNFHKVKKIVGYLDSAEVSLDICVYLITHHDITDAIAEAHKRGVLVRIITDHEMVFGSGSRLPSLHDLGILVKTKYSTGMMHHKFCIIDSPSRVAEINSEMCVNECSAEKANNNVKCAEKAKDEVKRAEKGHAKVNCAEKGHGKVNCAEKGQDKVNCAKKTKDAVKCVEKDKVKCAEKAKMKVKCAERYPFGLLLHGSMNWTLQAATGNWENVLVLNDVTIVELFQQTFNKIWEEFSPMVLTSAQVAALDGLKARSTSRYRTDFTK